MQKHDKGFTLIELLIVIVILGILAGVVVFAVGNITENAEENACKSEERTVETAVEAYRAATGEYPDDLDDSVGTEEDDFLREEPAYWTVGDEGAVVYDGPKASGENCQEL
jgi:prepilin-type N-terminal cleavage/methylation domain-containing protein